MVPSCGLAASGTPTTSGRYDAGTRSLFGFRCRKVLAVEGRGWSPISPPETSGVHDGIAGDDCLC